MKHEARSTKHETRRRFRISDFGFRASRPGVALLLAILLLAVLLTISLGIFEVVFGEIRITEELSDSFVALYAADQGLERLLRQDLVDDSLDDCEGVSPCEYGPETFDFGGQRCGQLSLRRTGNGQTLAESVGEFRCGSERSVKRRLVTSYQKAQVGGGFSPDSGGTLESGLMAYWPLDETSGVRNDVRGANHLSTGNPPVTSQPGIVGRAARFQASQSKYLFIADNADFSTGDIDFTVAAWVYLDSKLSTEMNIVNKNKSNNGGSEYRLYWEPSADRFAFQLGTAVSVTANTFGEPSVGTWYFVAAWHDAALDQIAISVNGEAVNTASDAGSGISDGSFQFRIGSRETDAGSDRFWNGRIDEVGFWKRVLTAQERADLYNAGNGNTCAAPCQ